MDLIPMHNCLPASPSDTGNACQKSRLLSNLHLAIWVRNAKHKGNHKHTHRGAMRMVKKNYLVTFTEAGYITLREEECECPASRGHTVGCWSLSLLFLPFEWVEVSWLKMWDICWVEAGPLYCTSFSSPWTQLICLLEVAGHLAVRVACLKCSLLSRTTCKVMQQSSASYAFFIKTNSIKPFMVRVSCSDK